MDVRLYLKRPEAKEATSIFARISYMGGPLKYYLPEKINPAYWNKATQRSNRSKDFPEYPEFNARLDNLEQTIKTVFRKYQNDTKKVPSPTALKELLDHAFQKKVEMTFTFLEYFKDFNKRSQNGERISPKTKKAPVYNTNKGYQTTFQHLEEFQKTYNRRIDFDSVDLEFYNEYVKYLTVKVRLGLNTIGDHIKRIKTVLADAQSRKIEVNPAFESAYFAKPSEETDSIYLPISELKQLEELDLSENKKLERVRDLFLIGCYTGLRYSDYSMLRPDQISDGFITTRQQKTGKEVVIPVHQVVDKLLKKYDGMLPPSISNQKTNEYLKELGQLIEPLKNTITLTYTKGGSKVTRTLEKWTLFSTHTARRSFATNEYLAGTPILSIMAITGHRTEKSFLRYIKLTSKDHAKLLKMHWDEREKAKTNLKKAL
jgi:integrase